MRAELVGWLGGLDAQTVTGYIGELLPEQAEAVVRRARAAAGEAELYYVNDELTDLARQIGAGLDTYAVDADDDLPSPCGLLMWSRPVTTLDPDIPFQPNAVAWAAAGNHIQVQIYAHLDSQPRRAAKIEIRSLRNATGVRRFPDLHMMWETRMIADGKERPWESTEDDDPMSYELLRGLVATWLLIRQPADSRSRLHDIEDLTAPKASHRRIAAAGGDPTRTTRYVTLRKRLRDPDAEPAPGDANRVYHHRWFVRPHRVTVHPATGTRRVWRGPYLAVPPGCEDAPILGTDRVFIVRR
ncbi:hypothetical protein AB0I28_32370 [Phytomonospora sp. NPDC050363]|uniref:hypothetical protein n=1 Tax=Phytomonospora sp. NPDC050363 TaxID=3155642 RepID=UPI0033DC1401